MGRSWRDEYRRCERCRVEYRPQREAQGYCSRDCRRAAAYGRERFKAGTAGRRRRRLEASDKAPATVVAGSFRNGVFSSIETGCYKPTKSLFSVPLDVLGRGYRWHGAPKLDRRVWEEITWCEIGEQIEEIAVAA